MTVRSQAGKRGVVAGTLPKPRGGVKKVINNRKIGEIRRKLEKSDKSYFFEAKSFVEKIYLFNNT